MRSSPMAARAYVIKMHVRLPLESNSQKTESRRIQAELNVLLVVYTTHTQMKTA